MSIKKLTLYLTTVIFLFSIACKDQPKEDLSTIQMVSPNEMEELIKIESTQLVDVRTEKEFASGHIEGAHNIVYDEHFIEKLASLDKSKPVAVYCHSGGRSEKCAKILKEAGFKKIYDLKGGITQWVYHKKDTIK
ncbi:rhodanese-like domain-containing protein [Mesonia aquimarina]|uniref:rhodanese-like domain-containing protein n=1 Tax=Mesonia aquimarina TaxID=1504967 RepID=UPI0013CF0249|nr:rhodanese-like domain-containing protein [Mesonia aquimarina]